MKRFLFVVMTFVVNIMMFAQPQYTKLDMSLETRADKAFPKEFTMGNAILVDYNNDGWLDVALKGSAYWTQSETAFLKNTNGSLALDKSFESAFPHDSHSAFRAIDFNNDGNVDLVSAGESTWRLWKNIGGIYTEVESFAITHTNLCKTKSELFYDNIFCVADMNNDGYQDIITFVAETGEVVVLEGNGSGMFTEKVISSTGRGTASGIAVGDINGDALKDIVVAGWGSNGTCIEVLMNLGNSAYMIKDQTTTGAQNSTVVLTDLNGDHRLDYLCAGESNDGANWWTKPFTMSLNTGNYDALYNTDVVLASSGMTRGGIGYVDFDGDGDVDVYASGDNCTSGILTYVNDGAGNFTHTSSGSLSEYARGGVTLETGDFTNDGYPDLIVMGYADSGEHFKIYQNNGEGQDGIAKCEPLAAPSQPVAMATSDGVAFSWDRVSKALLYNIYVKTKSGKIITTIPADPATGFLKVADLGSGITSNFYTIKGLNASDIAEWGVQTINAGKMGGAFAIGSVNEGSGTGDSTYDGALSINNGLWNILYNKTNKTLTYKHNGNTIVDGAFVRIANKPDQSTTIDVLTSKDALMVTLNSETVSDEFGSGTKYTYAYRCTGNVDLEQTIYIYDNYPYLLTQTSAVSDDTVRYNYVAPVVSDTKFTTILPSGGDNRVFDMPFDNDAWHTFDAIVWNNANGGNTSMEATALYDVNSRKGVVFGTVDHDTWKTGLKVTTSGSNNELAALEIFSGCVNERTWDIIDGEDRYSMPRHGYVKGKRVSSSRVFVGVFDDWRDGLETYGKANAIVHPKRAWDGGTMFGWQSWGGMAQYVNQHGCYEVSDYFATTLPHVVNEQGKQIMILDSYWSNMNDSQIKAFVRRCEKKGQIVGIYDTPYTFWGGVNDVDWWGTGIDGYVYGDIVLRANGKPRKISGVSIDPTHPVTKQMVKKHVERLKGLGIKYIKIDFMNNAALEADSYYDPNITTGMQAYNEGLRYYAECCGDDIFINLSIAPVWPAHYAQGRRIGCDAWGEINQSMYTLNCMNLSWWLEQVYSFNDPDHVVYVDKSENADKTAYDYKNSWSEKWNRIRTTTGIMCGTMVLGDNFSLNQGTCPGIQLARDRAELMMSVPEILDIARFGKMFRPVEGSIPNAFQLWGTTDWCDNIFTLDTDKAWYVALFNFKTVYQNTTLNFARLGIDASNVKAITELWNSTSVSFDSNGFSSGRIPSKDVFIFKIDKIEAAGIEAVQSDAEPTMTIGQADGRLTIDASQEIALVNVYGTDGRLCASRRCGDGLTSVSLPFAGPTGIYIIQATTTAGNTMHQKIVRP